MLAICAALVAIVVIVDRELTRRRYARGFVEGYKSLERDRDRRR